MEADETLLFIVSRRDTQVGRDEYNITGTFRDRMYSSGEPNRPLIATYDTRLLRSHITIIYELSLLTFRYWMRFGSLRGTEFSVRYENIFHRTYSLYYIIFCIGPPQEPTCKCTDYQLVIQVNFLKIYLFPKRLRNYWLFYKK